MLLELILITSLGTNFYLFQEKGEIEQKNVDLVQTVKEQDKLIKENYKNVEDTERALAKTKQELEKLYTVSTEQSIELEKLRHTNTVVRNYLEQAIPPELIQHTKKAHDSYQNSDQNYSIILPAAGTLRAIATNQGTLHQRELAKSLPRMLNDS